MTGGVPLSFKNRTENISKERLVLRVLPDVEEDGNLKVYVSFHKIAFSTKRADMNGGMLVSEGVYFSPLAHMLYVYNVMGGKDFEEAKERARNELRKSINARKSVLERSDDRFSEVRLLQRALLLL
jgi:hypothetical protein